MKNMPPLEKTQLQLGYIPLLDCIALLWADHRGYFKQVGLDVTLVKEASWASLRDRLAFGILDGAHCLSAMLPAAAAGADQIGIALQTPLVLSSNCAFISLNQKLCHDLHISEQDSAQSSAQKLVAYLKNGHDVALADVFKHSIHHYCLKNWLALADDDFAQNFQLKTLPPPYMVGALQQRSIDGFCVSEAWNTEAALAGLSKMIVTGTDVIPAVCDKVFAVTREWAQQHPQTLVALTAAIMQAIDDLGQLKDYAEVWRMLQDYQIIRFECSELVHVQHYYRIQNIIRDCMGQVKAPSLSDLAWFSAQLSKWEKRQLSDAEIQQMSESCIENHSFAQAKQLQQQVFDA